MSTPAPPRPLDQRDPASAEPSRSLAFGGFRLELARQRLVGPDGATRALSGRAFDVLAYLIAHREHVVSKDELMKAAWPCSIVEENNLNQAISAARRALGDSREEPRFILTVAGRGYRFIADIEQPGEPVPDAPARVTAAPATTLEPAVAPQARPAASRRLLLLGLGAATAAVAGGVWWSLRRRPASPGPKSIAVLPFRPLLPETRNSAMELGVTELLVNRLSRLPGVAVAPLSSVMRFGAPDVDPIEAGRKLGVEAVVDGHVQVHDGRIRLTARLIAVSNGEALWANSFTERLGELLAVQEALAIQLADAITAELRGDARSGVIARETTDVEAWQLYANGRFLVERRDAESLREAIRLLEAALMRDPSFARASAGLSHAHTLTAMFLIESPTRALGRAREAALRAVELDPRLPDGHIALGHVVTEHDRDLPAARRHYDRALELDPVSARAQGQLALNLTQAGDLAGAREAIRKAQLLEPANYAYLSLSGFIRYFERAYEESERELSRLVESVPMAALARQFLAYTMLVRKKGAQVLQLLDGRNDPAPTAYGNLARALVQTGDLAAARREIARLEHLGAQGFGVDYALAAIHVELGEHPRALTLLEGAGADAQMLGYLNVDPALDPIRGDPRFRAVAQRWKLN